MAPAKAGIRFIDAGPEVFGGCFRAFPGVFNDATQVRAASEEAGAKLFGGQPQPNRLPGRSDGRDPLQAIESEPRNVQHLFLSEEFLYSIRQRNPIPEPFSLVSLHLDAVGRNRPQPPDEPVRPPLYFSVGISPQEEVSLQHFPE